MEGEQQEKQPQENQLERETAQISKQEYPDLEQKVQEIKVRQSVELQKNKKIVKSPKNIYFSNATQQKPIENKILRQSLQSKTSSLPRRKVASELSMSLQISRKHPLVLEKQFYAGKGNNPELIAQCLQERGWQPVAKENQKFAQLRWTQLVKEIDFTFISQKQVVNHIPNILKIIASKTSWHKLSRKFPNLVPESYNLATEAALFLEKIKNGIWIWKPPALNCGKGIKIYFNLKELKESIKTRRLTKGVIQRYIEQPLLLENRKFDIRAYILIASTTPVKIFRYQDYYIRRSLDNYSLSSQEEHVHLTNAAIQKKQDKFYQEKENSIWSRDQLINCVGQQMVQKIEEQMHQYMTLSMQTLAGFLEKKEGTFELLGLDFMSDAQGRLYLIEFNSNPAIFTDTQVQGNIIPNVIREALEIVLSLRGLEGNMAVSKFIQVI